jgi:hypothetical protein
LPKTGDGCGASSKDEITICGRRPTKRSRYRIPEGFERKEEKLFIPRVIAGDTISHGTAVSSSAPCGPFMGARTCSDAEAALYGYEKGRDPITFISRIIKEVSDGE